MKKTRRRKLENALALILTGILTAGSMVCHHVNAQEEKEEILLMNVDFSGLSGGASVGGSGSTSFGRIIGNSAELGTYANVEEDNDNRYAAFRFEESAAKNASMIGLSYRGFTYNDIIIKIRMRIRDYGGSASFQFRMPYFDEAKNKTVENIIGLLTVDKGKVCFLGENTEELIPLDQWTDFAITMNMADGTASLSMQDSILAENKAFTNIEGTSIENTGNNFRLIASRAEKGIAAEIDVDYFRVTATAPPFDPWSRIQLTEEQEEMVKKIIDQNQGTHPYLYFTEADLSGLREKIKQGRSRKAYELLEQEAMQIWQDIDVNDYVFGTALGGRRLQKEIAYMTFYGYLAQKQEYLQKAADLLAKAADQVSVNSAFGMNDALAVGDFAHIFVLGYDWLYHIFTDDQRETVQNAVIEFAEWIFDNSFMEAWGNEETKRLVWNWNSVTHGPLGMAAIILDPDSLGEGDEQIRKAWLSRSIQRMAGYCTYSKDATGMSYEGLSYLGYGMHSLVPLAVAVNARIGSNWLDRFDHIKQVGTYQMQMNAPFGNMEGYYLNQGTLNSHFSTTFYLINLFGDREGLWGFDKTDYFTNYYSSDLKWTGNCYQLPQIIIFEDQTLEPKEPDTLMKVFEKGVVVGRDGYEDTSSMFAFNCATGNQSTWNHPDTNTFAFWAKGEAFVVDMGAGYKNSDQHNVVLVDGKGLNAEGGSTLNEGVLKQVQDYGNAVYALGDATPSYGRNAVTDKADRHIIYGRGSEPYVFTFDDFTGDGQQHMFSVNYYTRPQNTIEILDCSGIGEIARIRGGNRNNDCLALFFQPGGVSLTGESSEACGRLTAAVTDSAMNMGALFIVPDKKEDWPVIRRSKEADGFRLEIYLPENRLDVITAAGGAVQYSTAVWQEIPSGESVVDLNKWKNGQPEDGETEEPETTEPETTEPETAESESQRTETQETALQETTVQARSNSDLPPAGQETDGRSGQITAYIQEIQENPTVDPAENMSKKSSSTGDDIGKFEAAACAAVLSGSLLAGGVWIRRRRNLQDKNSQEKE